MSEPRQESSLVKQLLTTRRNALEARHICTARDSAIQLQNDKTLQVIDDAAQDELDAIDEALLRLDQGLYGACKKCGASIETGRLEALHAVTCARCAAFP